MSKFIIIMAIMLLPITSYAQVDRELITYNGQVGYFFSLEVGDKILADLIELKILKESKVPELELKISKQDEYISLLKNDLAISDELIKHWQDNYYSIQELRVEEAERYEKLLNKKNNWLTNPATMFMFGVIVGCAITVLSGIVIVEVTN